MKNNPIFRNIKTLDKPNDPFGFTDFFRETNKSKVDIQDSLLIKLWISKLNVITFNKIALSKLNSPSLILAFKDQIQKHEEQLKRIKISLNEAEYHYSFIKTNQLNSLLSEDLDYFKYSKPGGYDSRVIDIAINWIHYEITVYKSLSNISFVLHSNEVFKQTKLSLLEHKSLLTRLYQTKE